MITEDDLQRESAHNQKYALRFVAILIIAAACCASFVGLIASHIGTLDRHAGHPLCSWKPAAIFASWANRIAPREFPLQG